jgi:hypothetical protein
MSSDLTGEIKIRPGPKPILAWDTAAKAKFREAVKSRALDSQLHTFIFGDSVYTMQAARQMVMGWDAEPAGWLSPQEQSRHEQLRKRYEGGSPELNEQEMAEYRNLHRRYVETNQGGQDAVANPEHFQYLDKLRESGATNMYGAAPYLQQVFGMSKNDARDVLLDWMKNFDDKSRRGGDVR